MARPPRIYFEGAYYHVFSRGNGGQRIFFDDTDYRNFLLQFIDLRKLRDLTFFAYCLMPNHFHFLLRVGRFALPKLMQSALGHYARILNIRRETFGHVFQGRYQDRLCSTESYFLELVRYIHNNPVKAALCDLPRDWPWSSDRALTLGLPDPLVNPSDTLAHFGKTIVQGRNQFLGFMGQQTDWIPDYMTEDDGIDPPSRASRLEASRKGSLEELAQAVIAPAGITIGQLRIGVSATEVANFLGCSQAAISQVIKRKGPIC